MHIICIYLYLNTSVYIYVYLYIYTQYTHESMHYIYTFFKLEPYHTEVYLQIILDTRSCGTWQAKSRLSFCHSELRV